MTDTNNYSETAAKHFKEGYNCAQSVLLAFSDILGMDKKTILKLSSSFGGGMGRMREVCGAVSAMFIIAGLLKGYTAPDNDKIKSEHYKLIQDLAKDFKTCHHTIICRELLGLKTVNNDTPDSKNEKFSYIPSKRSEEYYKKRPCEDFIRTAARIIENKVLTYKKPSAIK